jgi:hypothetical protein
MISTGFLPMFKAVSRALGFEDLPVAEYPGIPPMDSDATLRAKVKDHLVPNIVRGFSNPVSASALGEDEPAPGDIVFRGSFDEVQDYFHSRYWSDGLTIVPPERHRVEAFLAFTDRSPDEVLGVLLPERRKATVWSVAVNGVMAGCRPEYMPVLIAAVEAISDPLFHLEDAGSTPSWEPLVIVSGPGVQALGMNAANAVLKVGVQSNTTIGRFLRLYMRNIPGFRPWPAGNTDKGTIGFTFNVALAENAAAIEELAWPTYQEDRGFDRDDTVVTVLSLVGTGGPLYSSGETAAEQLETIVQVAACTAGNWIGVGVFWGEWHPLLVLNPSVAAVLAADGLTKDDIRDHLYTHAKVPARWLDRNFEASGFNNGVTLAGLVAKGVADACYAESDDPDRLVPAFLRPETINIVLAGDPARNQSRFYINNHNQGVPVSRRVRFRARAHPDRS